MLEEAEAIAKELGLPQSDLFKSRPPLGDDHPIHLAGIPMGFGRGDKARMLRHTISTISSKNFTIHDVRAGLSTLYPNEKLPISAISSFLAKERGTKKLIMIRSGGGKKPAVYSKKPEVAISEAET